MQPSQWFSMQPKKPMPSNDIDEVDLPLQPAPESWRLDIHEQPRRPRPSSDFEEEVDMPKVHQDPHSENSNFSATTSLKSALRRTSKPNDLKDNSCSLSRVQFATMLEVRGVGRHALRDAQRQLYSKSSSHRVIDQVTKELARQNARRQATRDATRPTSCAEEIHGP